METNHLEEKENISQQKEQLKRGDRRELLDCAAELAKQVLTLFKVPNFQLKLET